MRLDPHTSKIGDDTVTHFSMVHSPSFDALEAAIGGIVVEFARLEYLIKVGIEQLSRRQLEGEHVTDKEIDFTEGMEHAEKKLSRFKTQSEHLCALLANRETDASKRESFVALSEDLTKIANARNSLIHSPWSGTDDDKTWIMLRSRVHEGKLDQYAQRVSLDELAHFRGMINVCWAALVFSLGGEIGPTVPVRGDFVTSLETP